MQNKKFGICPDGDFIAYKAVRSDGLSDRSGEAFVNGKKITGRIPYQRNTIVEMPRSTVVHDPHDPCNRGLHASSWDYIQYFRRVTQANRTLIVKINPRDVVSVPTDHSDAKLRTCRLRVLDVTDSEDMQALYVPDPERLARYVEPRALPEVEENGSVVSMEPQPQPKRQPRKAKKAAKQEAKMDPSLHYFPAYYEEFTKVDWEYCTMDEMRFVAKEWAIVPLPKAKAAFIAALIVKGRARRRTW